MVFAVNFRWKATTSAAESHTRESSASKSRSSSSSSVYERDRLLYSTERGQLGRSASLEDDRARETAAQIEEMIRSGRLPPPIFDAPLPYRPFPPPPMMDMAQQSELFMRFLANSEAARLPHHAFSYFPPAAMYPFGGLAHLQAAAANHAAAAQAAHLAAAESHRDRHRDREAKSPREHKRDREHKYDKTRERDKHREKMERERERRDSPRPSSASGRSSTGSAHDRRDSVEQPYRALETRRTEDESSRVSEMSSHSSHGGNLSRAATPTVEEIDVGSPPSKKFESTVYPNDRIKSVGGSSHSPAGTVSSSYMSISSSTSVSAPQTSFNFSVSHLAEPARPHSTDRKSPLERSCSTGSAASESSHASEHSLARTSSTGSSISHHRTSSIEHNIDSYPVFPLKQPNLESKDSGAGGVSTSSATVPLFPSEATVTSTGLYRPSVIDSESSCSASVAVSSVSSAQMSHMSHSAAVTTSNVTSSASDTSVTSTYSTNKAISSPPRTYEYTHKKFAHRPMTKKERILGGKSTSVLPSQVTSLTAATNTTASAGGATSSVFPTRPLEFSVKRVTEDPSSPERHTKKARILGVQRPTKVVSSILKEYSFYHRHQRHINQDYLVHMPKGKLEKKAKRRNLVGMPMKRKKRRTPRDSMYMYPTRTGLRSASKPEDKDGAVPEETAAAEAAPAPKETTETKPATVPAETETVDVVKEDTSKGEEVKGTLASRGFFFFFFL